MDSVEPSLEELLQEKKRVRNPFVPIGALMTAGVLTAGLISFRRGNSRLGQTLMRARVVVQGATVALMVGTAYYYGDTPWKSNWDLQRGAYKMTRENMRNWMLAWEDGFCNFYASAAENCDVQHCNGLPPELFFRMSHEIHNCGKDVIGKVAAERGHICIHSEQHNLSALQNSEDMHPKTWRAQFQSGIKTIALIAVDDGHVLQLGAIEKVTQDLSYVIQLQKKFKYLLSIPGFLLPHPSYSRLTGFPFSNNSIKIQHPGPFNHVSSSSRFNDQPVTMTTTPSMISLETLLLKLPAVLVPAGVLLPPPPLFQFHESPPWFSSSENPHEEVVMGMEQIAKHALD
ncbi:hypothetical protein LWI28_014216 [Acer negundo]|uniref:HIG1 domain-containing protein n=1 Tax=Acer negundo TaxID=4023 RepID=A0AAD5IQ31_ACENE|nr:hypothetical protein LWI28_014216 [Acer negundo]